MTQISLDTWSLVVKAKNISLTKVENILSTDLKCVTWKGYCCCINDDDNMLHWKYKCIQLEAVIVIWAGHWIRVGSESIVNTQIMGHYDAKLLIQGTIMVSLASNNFDSIH